MLKIIISGAGIAGLAAAISLRRVGHEVHVYERSTMHNEVGAAIFVAPNVNRILTAWGLDLVKNGFDPTDKIVHDDPFTLERIATLFTGDQVVAMGGATNFQAHRVDLHNGLKWLATRSDGPGTPVVLHPRSEVIAYNTEKPSITLSSGKEIEGDAVIAADGVHTKACQVVIGRVNDAAPAEVYNCAYRFLIPASSLEADEETISWVQDTRQCCRVIPDNDTRRRIIAYSCRNNTLHNFVCMTKNDAMTWERREDWHATVEKSEVLDLFSDFSPKLLRVMRKAADVKRWPLLYRPPIDTWVKGGLALAGDAAHPTLPRAAQGAAQGIEDGLALGIVLHGATCIDVSDRLVVYDKIRRSRASIVQIMSNFGLDQVEVVKQELLQFIDENERPKTMRDAYKFIYRYDAVGTAVDAMCKLDVGFMLPSDFFDQELVGLPGL